MLRRLIWRPALPAAPATTPSPLLRLPNYFARPREESLLTRQLRGTPRLTVVLGAGMSGKSAVLTGLVTRSDREAIAASAGDIATRAAALAGGWATTGEAHR